MSESYVGRRYENDRKTRSEAEAHFCEQEISASFSHKLFKPDVSPKFLARFDWLGTFRDDGNDRSVKR